MNFTEEEKMLIIEGLVNMKVDVCTKFKGNKFVDESKLNQYINSIDNIIDKISVENV